MKVLFSIFLILILSGCSFGGFKPAPPYYHWQLHNEKALFPNSDPDVLTKYLARRKKRYEGLRYGFCQW